MWYETYHADGPGRSEMQALRKNRYETATPKRRSGPDQPLET